MADSYDSSSSSHVPTSKASTTASDGDYWKGHGFVCGRCGRPWKWMCQLCQVCRDAEAYSRRAGRKPTMVYDTMPLSSSALVPIIVTRSLGFSGSLEERMSASFSAVDSSDGCIYNWCWIHLFRLYLVSSMQYDFEDIIGDDALAMNIAEYCNGIDGPNHVMKKKVVRWIRNLAVVFLSSKVLSDFQMIFQTYWNFYVHVHQTIDNIV